MPDTRLDNSNLAYDISVYEPKPKRTEPKTEQQSRIQVKKGQASRVLKARGLLALGAAALILGLFMLCGQVEQNRLFGEISQLESEIRTLQADNAALAAEYDSIASLKNVEEYAKNTLGLTKLEKSQIEYVEFETDGVISSVDSADENIFVRLRNWLSSVGEYLGAE